MKREAAVDCERVLQDDVAVAYLRDELPEEERDAFERHYFECAACFEKLQVIRDLGTVLARRDTPVARPASGERAGRRAPAVTWLAWAAGAAFVAVGAAVVVRNAAPPAPLPSAMPSASSAVGGPPSGAPTAPASPARPPFEALARVEPPPYAPLVVRGMEPAGSFDRAMERYVRGEYAQAAAGLRAALGEDPASVEARFYLGISALLAGNAEEAIRELARVAGGDDPDLAEAARYYLAKAYLGRGEVGAARRALRPVAQGDGAHKERAQQLLQALGAEP
jgi:tetratricopeptide (TPR) repeat protein